MKLDEKLLKDYEVIEEFLQYLLGINDYEGIFPNKFEMEVDEDYDIPGYYIVTINVLNKKNVVLNIHIKGDEVCLVNDETFDEVCKWHEVKERVIIEIIYQLAK